MPGTLEERNDDGNDENSSSDDNDSLEDENDADNSQIAVCFLWLSLPGDYRVTDEALLAETT